MTGHRQLAALLAGVVLASPAAPNGTITNGGGVEILDPEGKRLAVTGSQAKP